MKAKLPGAVFFLAATFLARAEKPLTSYVNPFLGTAPLTNVADIGFVPPWRVWAGLTFPGASLPNAMVQLSPITKFHSGAGYEYEDSVIHGFAHSNKGHWNLCHIPILPAAGEVDPNDFGSAFNHTNESASPGYYQVFLERNKINAELTTTLRCGFHRYTFKDERNKKLVVNLAMSNERVTDWSIEPDGDLAFKGFQKAGETVYFYAVANEKITNIEMLPGRDHKLPVIHFADTRQLLEIRIGLSFVSVANAKKNLEAELSGKSFNEVRIEASRIWEELLSKIKVAGGTERQRGLFYSCLYRSFLWPALRSDVNGEFLDENRRVVSKGFRYYTIPSLWDDYRNKLVLLGMLSPDVTQDVIQSLIDRGECTGFMPTFFHGDHAAAFISGSYLRGLRGYDVQSAYRLLLKNATVERRRARPHLAEYIAKGYISTPAIEHPNVETVAKAGTTKTLEYAYDDYAVALLARELKDETNYTMLMKRAGNYTNVFDAETGLMRGRLENGDWVKPFDPQYPYYEYMYREANAWQSSFFAPHDTEGLIKLYPSKQAFEQQLDRLFSIPWNPKHIAMNINSFIGQYCHGNQPDHGFPYLYYWIGKPEKSQAILNTIMDRFYGMDSGLTLCGMDDAGEMSSWYVFNAIGLYPYSPADENYIVTVPIFDEVKMQLGRETLTIQKRNSGLKMAAISYADRKVEGYFISHHELARGKKLVIATEPAESASASPDFNIRTADEKCTITINTEQAVGLKDWAESKLAPVLGEWYPKIAAALASDGYTAPDKFKITLKPMKGVAFTSGRNVVASSDWLTKELSGEALGSLVHEAVHVVQNFNGRNPGWLVEGSADYIRWFQYEPQSHGADIVWMRKYGKSFSPTYKDGYRVTANFLNWVSEKYDKDVVSKMNAAMRQNRYDEVLWKEYTGRTVSELGEEWKNEIMAQLAAPVEAKSAN